MSLLTGAINTTLATAYARPCRQLRGLSELRASQTRHLLALLDANADSQFGRAHDFAKIGSVEDFRRAVPLSTWDDYQSAVEEIAAGEPGVLTSEPVRLLEPSSGSTAATKLVPYTATLAREFRAGLEPWLHDLYTRIPGLRAGRSYWSVTPAATHPKRQTVVPIGFEDDADYLGPIASRLLSRVFAVPAEVARAASMDEFRARTGTALLQARDLSLVSVWNPTFFTLLLDWMVEHADQILPALPARRRVAVETPLRAGDWPTIWPRLGLISCWADAQAARPATDLANRLPQARLQPKGLLATEAIISIPLVDADGAVLAARSHFFEFVDADARLRLADELEVGGRYEVVVTTGGGLYRYRLGDLVEVTGQHGALPTLRFVGRGDKVSDLVGEKLNEAFVASCLAQLGLAGFAMLVPRTEPQPHYALYAAQPTEGLDEKLDAALRESFHYDYARRLGQLGPVVVVEVAADAEQRYLAARVAAGQRLGDIKPPVLGLTDASGP